MLIPREKSPPPENVPRGGSNPLRCGQRAQTLPTSYSGPFCFVTGHPSNFCHTVAECLRCITRGFDGYLKVFGTAHTFLL